MSEASFLRTLPTQEGVAMPGDYRPGVAPKWFSEPLLAWAKSRGIACGDLSIQGIAERCVEVLGLRDGHELFDHCGTMTLDGQECFVCQPYDKFVSAAKPAHALVSIVRCGLAIRSPGIWNDWTTLYAFVELPPPGRLDLFEQLIRKRKGGSRCSS